MCCAEGQHSHNSHLVRKPNHDEKAINEWVDTHHELHVNTAETVKILPNVILTITLPSISSKLGLLLSSEKSN
jgi:hypothetical protein